MKIDLSKLNAKIDKVAKYIENDASTRIGVEAVNHFKESFKKQGFTDTSLEKWEEVERRKPDSSWYGFKYGSRVARPGVKRRKENSITNYAPIAGKRAILHGETMELMQSIDWEKQGKGATITAATPYAKIQNEGGDIQIFGKTKATIKARQFMGKSEVLRKKKFARSLSHDQRQVFTSIPE